MAHVFINSSERRVMFQSFATALRLGCSPAEATAMLVSAWKHADRQDRAAVAKNIGNGLVKLRTELARPEPGPAPGEPPPDEDKEIDAPLLAVITAAFDARTGSPILGILEYSAFAMPRGHLRRWATEGTFELRIADIFEAASKGAATVMEKNK